MGNILRTRLVIALICLLSLVAPTLAQAPGPVDLELALAIDVSASVDPDEAALQREGYLKALVDPVVLRAIATGKRKKIAVTYFEWASTRHLRLVVDWTVISDQASADAFVKALAAAPISTEAGHQSAARLISP